MLFALQGPARGLGAQGRRPGLGPGLQGHVARCLPRHWRRSSRSASPTASASRDRLDRRAGRSTVASGSNSATCWRWARCCSATATSTACYTERPLLDPAYDRRGRGPAAGPGCAEPARSRPQRQLPRVPPAGTRTSAVLAVRRPAAGGDAQRRWALADAMVGQAPGRSAPGAVVDQADRRDRRRPARARAQRFPLRGRPGRHPLPVRRAHPPHQSAHRRPARRPGQPCGDVCCACWASSGSAFRDDMVASTRFHRLVRRGREYGPRPAARGGSGEPGPDEPRGLHFICLVPTSRASSSSCRTPGSMNAKFDGLSDESDPLLGNREPLHGGGRDRPLQPAARRRPAAAGSRTCLPQFVTVRGGAYFFLPGIRALRYITEARRMTERPGRPAGPARAAPRAAGGAACRAAARAVLPPRRSTISCASPWRPCCNG